MRTIVMKWATIAALALAVAFWAAAAIYQLALNVVVSAAAVVLVVQAAQAKKCWWAVAFLANAVLYSAVSSFRLEGRLALLLVALSIVPFAVSLITLKPQPLLSVPSITDRNPGSQAL